VLTENQVHWDIKLQIKYLLLQALLLSDESLDMVYFAEAMALCYNHYIPLARQLSSHISATQMK